MTAGITIYDTRTGSERPFVPVHPGRVGVYVCGVTPYAAPHVGHARPLVIWDVIRTHLERRGYLVTLVQNFTDVDDKLIERAAREGTSVTDLAARHSAEYLSLMKRLMVRPPDIMPRATEHVADIIDLIGRLLQGEYAYTSHGDVYFRVEEARDYGLLPRRDVEAMKAGARLEPNPLKRDPRDFALWKRQEPGEPWWPSPFGDGRPGWHVECSAMAHRYLGTEIDLHGGGLDLVFPHHENERVQSEAGYGVPVHVRFWVHNGLVTTDGTKMSKSLENGADLAELIHRYGGPVVRGFLLSAHYRSPIEFSLEGLSEYARAYERIERLREATADAAPSAHDLPGEAGGRLMAFPERLLQALDRDFNTARAFAELFDMIRAANSLMAGPAADRENARGFARRNLEAADRALGLFEHDGTAISGSLPDDVRTLVERRDEARARRDFAEADRLRDAIKARGYQVEDTPEGSVARAVSGRRG
ncbi:MAG: cysteine--tRNA ligase [Clostridia bacterium]